MDPDSARFETIFRRNYGAVVRYAMRRVGPDAADEIINETFLVAWRRLDEVPDNALRWLYATARRFVANEIRRRDRQQRLGRRVADEPETPMPDHGEVLSESLRVRGAIDALSERDQEVIRLSAWEQLGAADAARALGCSVAAYKVRLHRARRRVAALLIASEARLDELLPQGDTR